MITSSPTLHPALLENTNVLSQDSPGIQNHRHLWLVKRIHVLTMRFESRLRPKSPPFSSLSHAIINAILFAQNKPLLRQCCVCPEGSFYLQVVSCSQSLLVCRRKLGEKAIKIRDKRSVCGQSLPQVSDPIRKQNYLTINIRVRTRYVGRPCMLCRK
jgi:hypothetical protein